MRDSPCVEIFLAQLVLAGLLGGCATSTPVVPTGPHPEGQRVVSVPFPPPPAEVEVIPLQRRPSCLWRDGSWDFRAGAWEWAKGSWVEPDTRCFYAPPRTRFESTPTGTTLVYSRGQWYEQAAPSKPCQPPPACAETSDQN